MTNEAFEAGKNGEPWYRVRDKYGDNYSIKSEYERGHSARLYGDTGGRQAFADGANIIVILIAIFYIFMAMYFPFIVVAAALLLPFALMVDNNHFIFSEFLVFLTALLIIVYFLSCAYEYFRGRMLETRNKNRKWKKYYAALFTIRILFPGLFFVFLGVLVVTNGFTYAEKYNVESFLSSLCCGAVISGLYAWRIKILNPNKHMYFTEWALRKGIKSMEAVDYVPAEPSKASPKQV